MRMNPKYIAIAVFLTVGCIASAVAGVALWWVWLVAFGVYTLWAIL